MVPEEIPHTIGSLIGYYNLPQTSYVLVRVIILILYCSGYLYHYTEQRAAFGLLLNYFVNSVVYSHRSLQISLPEPQ